MINRLALVLIPKNLTGLEMANISSSPFDLIGIDQLSSTSKELEFDFT
jgi:hypothetical protein